jgi:hypothetical protein
VHHGGFTILIYYDARPTEHYSFTILIYYDARSTKHYSFTILIYCDARSTKHYVLFVFLLKQRDFKEKSFFEITARFFRTENIFSVMKNKFMHYLSSVNFVTQPLHVSGMFIAHLQEVFTVHVQELVRSIVTRPAASQLKRTTRTNCCTYTVNTS